MALKLLTRKDTLLESKEMGVALKLGGLLPEHIAEMQGIRSESKNPAMALALYAMRHCMTELTIAGEDYSPRQLSYQIDTKDKECAAALTVIASLVIEHSLLDDDTRKKLQQQRTTSLQAKTEEAATTANTADKG